MVVVVDGNKIAKLKMARSACSFTCDTFHGATITKKHICVVGEQIKPGFVELRGALGLRDS